MIALALLHPPPALAAEADAAVRGTARAEDGAPLAGAVLLLTDASGAIVPLRTGPDGAFAADGLAPGAYVLSASVPGYAALSRAVALAPGEALVLEVVLAPDAAYEIEVVGRSEADELRRSADSVTVIETEDARRRTADLGELMARTQGLAVQRTGGLGSSERISLQGFTDDQIRFFLDGVPLRLAGYPFGVANVPVDLVERIEVYKGVVPLRLAADALGGAIHLVTPSDPGTHGGASVTAGSFDTVRFAASLRHRDPYGGLLARAELFHDASRNDYPIQVEVADLSGQLHPATVRRYHDGYRASGGAVELGVMERAAVERASLRLFASDHAKELQHNVVMTAPYGEVEYGGRSVGLTGRLGLALGPSVTAEGVAAWAHDQRFFRDVARCVYDWYGQCVIERAQPGEIGPAVDQLVADENGFGRALVAVALDHRQELAFVSSPTVFTRTGDDARIPPDRVDPLHARRDVASVVSGVEHALALGDDRARTAVFVKDYLQWVDSEEVALGGEDTVEAERSTHALGFGGGLRVAVTPDVLVKASGERATRLPDPEEIFGDGALVLDNPALVPERSWNANLELAAAREGPRVGALELDLAGFWRRSRDLIVLLGDERHFAWYNVYGARTVGVEGRAAWRLPREVAGLALTGTWQDVRNVSDEGAFGAFAGDRIPNRPWLFATSEVRLAWPEASGAGDALSLTVTSRYVHTFLRGWESVGLAAFKQTIPSQLSHAVALTWTGRSGGNEVAATLEAQNVTDAVVFDTFGVQRPGRAFYGKISVAR